MCWYTLGIEDVSLFLAILPEKKKKKEDAREEWPALSWWSTEEGQERRG